MLDGYLWRFGLELSFFFRDAAERILVAFFGIHLQQVCGSRVLVDTRSIHICQRFQAKKINFFFFLMQIKSR